MPTVSHNMKIHNVSIQASLFEPFLFPYIDNAMVIIVMLLSMSLNRLKSSEGSMEISAKVFD